MLSASFPTKRKLFLIKNTYQKSLVTDLFRDHNVLFKHQEELLLWLRIHFKATEEEQQSCYRTSWSYLLNRSAWRRCHGGPPPSSPGRLLSGNGSVSGTNTARARFRMQSDPSHCPDVKRSDALNQRLADVHEPAEKIRTERLMSRRHQETWHLDLAVCGVILLKGWTHGRTSI